MKLKFNPSNKTMTRIRNLCLVSCLLFAALLSAQSNTAETLPVDAKTQVAIIDSITQALNTVYVFPEVAQKMEGFVRQNYQQGKYNTSTALADFVNQLTTDLQSISHDKHLRVRLLPPELNQAAAPSSPEEEKRQRLERLSRENFGFKKVEILPGNIGYIDFRYFAEAELAGPTAIAAMNFLAYTDAIIFDLRQNGGGNPSMIQLITSYLFEEPVHLNSFYIRKTNETQQFWTQASVSGPRLAQTPVFVLTSNSTFSGAEEFTYNLKNLKRGTIIGETTGGGAHPVEFRAFKNLNVGMSLPFGRAVNPITGTNWEGVGVEPDLKVAADRALLTTRIEATKTLLAKASDELKKRQLAWAIKGLEIEQQPVQLDVKTLKEYVGSYGPRKIELENTTLYYQREGRPKYALIPMGDDSFMIKDLDYFRLKFNRAAAGKVVELVGMYDNGETDSHPKKMK